MESLIVKVQIVPGDAERAIVTDKERKYVLDVHAHDRLKARMGERQVAFFKAYVMTAAVDLLELVDEQPW